MEVPKLERKALATGPKMATMYVITHFTSPFFRRSMST
jgi:hypothetical protein